MFPPLGLALGNVLLHRAHHLHQRCKDAEERGHFDDDKSDLFLFPEPRAGGLLPCKQNFVLQSVYKRRSHPKPPPQQETVDGSRPESLLKALSGFSGRADIA